MQPLEFEWDPSKAASNLRKHGVSFDEAITVFAGPHVRIADHLHGPEERELVIGISSRLRLLTVVIYEREKNVIRIIGARVANRNERQTFIEQTQG